MQGEISTLVKIDYDIIIARGELDAEDNTIGPFETHVLMNHVLGRQDLQLPYHMHVVGSTIDRKMHL